MNHKYYSSWLHKEQQQTIVTTNNSLEIWAQGLIQAVVDIDISILGALI